MIKINADLLKLIVEQFNLKIDKFKKVYCKDEIEVLTEEKVQELIDNEVIKVHHSEKEWYNYITNEYY